MLNFFPPLENRAALNLDRIMKKIIALTLGLALAVNFAAQAEPTSADQKWLEVVQRIVSKGETRISTPSQERVTLFKQWAVKSGYAVVVNKTDLGYRLEFSRTLAQQ
jgi:hypothetical protein